MLENFITKTDKFDSLQVDHELINCSKSYFSIYNNKVPKPFHNFWFMLKNTKFKNEYNDYCILRFGLNHKETEVIRFISFFKELSMYLKNIFSKTFEDISIDLPWKEYENYPYMLSIFSNENTVFLGQNKCEIEKNNIIHNKTYSILFEIKNIKIIKINLDEKISNQLKFNLSALMIQEEPDIDLKSYLLNSINLNSEEKIYQEYGFNNKNRSEINSLDNNKNISGISNKPVLPFLAEVSNAVKNLNRVEIPTLKKNSLINLDELLTIKSCLKKVTYDEKSNILKSQNNSDDDISEIGNTYLNQKKQLKKTITEERTLLNHISKKDKKKKESKINIDTGSLLYDDMEKELEDIEKLEKRNKKEKKKKKKNKENKEIKKEEVEIDDLEKELEELR